MSKSNTSIFEGVIIPVEWDRHGNHTAVALAADNEQEYRISALNHNGRLMLKLVQRRVRIKGCQQQKIDLDQSNAIEITEYTILDDYSVKRF